MSDPLLKHRDRFPTLATKTYLASHTLGPVPTATRDALLEYHRTWEELGILAWDGPWWDTLLEFEELYEDILHAPRGTVAPVQNVTNAFAAITGCFDYAGARNKIVTTALEFTTTRPFMNQLRRIGAEVVYVPSDDGMMVSTERLIDAIDDRTALVVSSHAYFRSGAVQDLKLVAEAAHRKGALLVGDGYQATGTLPVDVVDLGADFYVGGSHKWLCGGAGAGYMYVRKELIEKLSPRHQGWFSLQDPFAFPADDAGLILNKGVHRFLGGTPNIPALYAAREGLKIIREIGDQAIRAKSLRLTGWCIEQAQQRGLDARTPAQPERRSGMVCINFEGAKEVCAEFARRGIICDYRPDCGIRISPHFFTTQDELDVFFAALDEARAAAVGA